MLNHSCLIIVIVDLRVCLSQLYSVETETEKRSVVACHISIVLVEKFKRHDRKETWSWHNQWKWSVINNSMLLSSRKSEKTSLKLYSSSRPNWCWHRKKQRVLQKDVVSFEDKIDANKKSEKKLQKKPRRCRFLLSCSSRVDFCHCKHLYKSMIAVV